jgi:hypothetical protein
MDTTDVDEHGRVFLLKRGDERQHAVDAALVRADEHTSLPHVPELGHGAGRLVRQPEQPGRVVEEELARVGEGAVARRAVDQAFAARVPSRRMTWLTAGCVRRSLRAPRETALGDTVTKTRRSSNVIK